jgi:hypothetical protein
MKARPLSEGFSIVILSQRQGCVCNREAFFGLKARPLKVETFRPAYRVIKSWRPETLLANIDFSPVFGCHSRSTAKTVVAGFVLDPQT